MSKSPTDALASSILQDIVDLRDWLIAHEYIVDYREIIKTEYERDKFEVAWDAPERIRLSYLFRNEERFRGAQAISNYRAILANRDYIARLVDGSLIQIAYRIADEEVIWHRLCWFPCPFAFTIEEAAEMGQEGIDLMDLCGLPEIQLVTPVRFDFDADFSDARHTHSHFTFNRSECRVPVFGPLSVGHFSKFAFKYFHPEWEGNFAQLDEVRSFLYSRTLAPPIQHELYMDTGVSHRFS